MDANLNIKKNQQIIKKPFLLFKKIKNNKKRTFPYFILEKREEKEENKNKSFNQKFSLILLTTKSMHSPFRGLRRAAASPGSPISCCSQTCNSSSVQISIPAFPRTHCAVMVIAGTRPPTTTIPPSSAGSCISPSSLWTPSSTAGGGVITPNNRQIITFPFNDDQQQNNENEQLILHFPHLPPSSNVLISKDNEVEQPMLINIEQQSLISHYGFQTHRPRPPLNRAIPPIPESRSNESIQSSQSMLARRPSNGLQLQTVQIIDENNPIDEPLPNQLMTTDDDVMGVSTTTIVETTKTSRLPKFVKKKEKKDFENEEKKQQRPPKSPLMSVAHSVKNRLSRLTSTKSGGSFSKNVGGELPMSRSLEIGHKSRIPHRKINEEIPKSKSMEEQRGRNDNSERTFLIPRRSPTTTLVLCSPGGGGLRRLPPDEFFSQEKESQLLSTKQVQFVDDNEINYPKLSPQKELAYCIWTPEKEEENIIEKLKENQKEEEKLNIEGLNEVKNIKEQEKNNIASSTIDLETNIGKLQVTNPNFSSFYQSQPEKEHLPFIQKLPSSEEFPISSVGDSVTKITTITTTRRSRSPPRVLLPSLRKSPQSFPPLGSSSLDSKQNSSEMNVRQTRSAVSVSFGEVDVKKYNDNQEKIKEPKEEIKQKIEEKSGKRRVFSTRSLRMVANRVCEASPLLRRRGHSANAPQNRQQETEKSSTTSTKIGFNNVSKNQPKTTKSSFIPAHLRSINNSVRTVQNNKYFEAPLAESESSCVANSPAVEQFPVGFPPKSLLKNGKDNKINFNTKRGGGFIFGTNSRFGRKEDKKLVNEQNKNKKIELQQQKNLINGSGGEKMEKKLSKNVTKTTLINGTSSLKSKSSSSFQRPALVARLSHKKSNIQAIVTSKGNIKKGDDSNKKEEKDNKNKEEIIKDNKQQQKTMLLSTKTKTTTSPIIIGSDFRLIDEPTSCVHSHSTPIIFNNNKINSSSSQSSLLLIAEQQSFNGEVSLKMLENKMNETNLGNSSSTKQNNRKRLSSEFIKLNDNNNNNYITATSTNGFEEIKKGPKEEQMPLADDLGKSEDCISFTPSITAASALVIDFRSDLLKLRESVQKDLKELETLRKQNASLQEQLSERNKIILHLQRQLRGDL